MLPAGSVAPTKCLRCCMAMAPPRSTSPCPATRLSVFGADCERIRLSNRGQLQFSTRIAQNRSQRDLARAHHRARRPGHRPPRREGHCRRAAVHVEGEAASDTLVVVDQATPSRSRPRPRTFRTQIVVSVEGLPAGTQILARDLKLPEGSSIARPGRRRLIVNITDAPVAPKLPRQSWPRPRPKRASSRRWPRRRRARRRTRRPPSPRHA